MTLKLLFTLNCLIFNFQQAGGTKLASDDHGDDIVKLHTSSSKVKEHSPEGNKKADTVVDLDALEVLGDEFNILSPSDELVKVTYSRVNVVHRPEPEPEDYIFGMDDENDNLIFDDDEDVPLSGSAL